MAIINAIELSEARRECARTLVINYNKHQINAALQAVEDAMVTTPIPVGAVGATVAQYVSNRMDNATSPLVLTAAQKKAIFAQWARLKFERDK